MLSEIAPHQNRMLEGADISNGYLYGDLYILVFMEQTTDSAKLHPVPVQQDIVWN